MRGRGPGGIAGVIRGTPCLVSLLGAYSPAPYAGMVTTSAEEEPVLAF
jgi:hypothetical protein